GGCVHGVAPTGGWLRRQVVARARRRGRVGAAEAAASVARPATITLVRVPVVSSASGAATAPTTIAATMAASSSPTTGATSGAAIFVVICVAATISDTITDAPSTAHARVAVS